MKINKKNIFFYVLYAFIALSFFLYMLFPVNLVKDYILADLNARYPRMSLSFRTLDILFPPGLKMEDISAGLKDSGGGGVRFTSLSLRPHYWGYITGKPGFRVNARIYGGNLEGVVPTALLLDRAGGAQAAFSFDGIDLEKSAYIRSRLGRRITGTFGGSLAYGGETRLDFTVKKGSYQLLENLFGISKLDFSLVEGQVSIKGNLLRVSKFKLTGDKINFSIKGDIRLNEDINSSDVNLSGIVEVVSLGNQKFSLLLTGTLGNIKTRYL